MRIRLGLTLNCAPDAAWRALRSPTVFRAVSRPFTTFTSREPEGFPDLWPAGDHPVDARAFGLFPLGVQVITISFEPEVDGVRTVVDTGHGESGALATVKTWRHTMSVSAAPRGRTTYRDQLDFTAGAATPLLWVVYAVFWQWRALRLRQLARRWHA